MSTEQPLESDVHACEHGVSYDEDCFECTVAMDAEEAAERRYFDLHDQAYVNDLYGRNLENEEPYDPEDF